MESVVQKWGGNLAVKIPPALVEEFSLKEGRRVQMRLSRGVLVLKPIRKHQRLSVLLEGITPQNRHPETP